MQFLLLLTKSIFTFIATEVDDFLVFVMLFAKTDGKSKKIITVLGQLTAIILVTAACGFAAFFLQKLPFKYLRLLGLIPVVIGVISIFDKDDDQAEEIETVTPESSPKTAPEQSKLISFYVKAFLLTLAASGDNIGIYIPFFVQTTLWQKLAVLCLFALLQILISLLQIQTARIPVVKKIIKKAGPVLEPVVFISLGIMIFFGL